MAGKECVIVRCGRQGVFDSEVWQGTYPGKVGGVFSSGTAGRERRLAASLFSTTISWHRSESGVVKHKDILSNDALISL